MEKTGPRDATPAGDAGEAGVERAALAREAMAVWNEEGLEAFAERYWHPDIVWEEPQAFPDSAVRRGRDECLRRMRERLSLLGHVELKPVDVTVVGDRVLIEATVSGKGASSGVPTGMREYFVLDSRGPQAVRFREFLDREAAAAALREP